MQYDIGQSGDPLQAAGPVEIGQHGKCAGPPPPRALRRIAQQGIDAVVTDQTRKSAARNVAAANNQ